MINFIKINSPYGVAKIIQDWDPLKDTWLVSDLKSKQEFQSFSTKRHGYFTDDSIMRVSDFWRLWLRRLDPTLKIVSSDFIKILVQNFVDIHASKLQLMESETSTLFRAVNEFAPILFHPKSRDVLEEWISVEHQKNGRHKKWEKWYKISRVCLAHILEKDGVIDGKWSAAYLQSQHLERILWPKRLFVEAGTELTGIELGIFKAISNQTEVFIITPQPDWKEKFSNLLSVYSDNLGFGKVTEIISSKKMNEVPAGNFIRLSTQLAEVKFAVSKVREWLDIGIAPKNISIVAADIEKYWPILKIYLDEEGVSCLKDKVAPLNSLGDVQIFLAAIKNYSSEVAWDSLERYFFGKENRTPHQFEKFKALFYQLYDAEDLLRDKNVMDLYYSKIDLSSDMFRDEFIVFLIKIWMTIPDSKNKSEIFESVFKDFLNQTLNVKLKTSRWVNFLKNRLSTKEVKLSSKSSNGIHIDSLMSIQLSEITHKIYLGLNDEFFAKKSKTLMSFADSKSLKSDFDLSVDCSEESNADFQMRWQFEMADENSFFTSAHLSFEADPLNASLFFIECRPTSEIEVPSMTRLDELMKQYEDLERVPASSSYSKVRIDEDLIGMNEKLQLSQPVVLSVNDLENYSKCSFKLLAGKIFKLRDYSQVGIDLDPREKGTLAHGLFEFLIRDRKLLKLQDNDIENFLDLKRTESKLYPGQDDFWSVQKTRLKATAKKFIDFEKNRISLFDANVEVSKELYFDLNAKEFSLTAPKRGFKFNLRIDRYDIHKDKNFAIIYDYKSSDFGLKSTPKWISEKQFQMLLYIKALKLTLPPNIITAGALYYLYRKLNFSKGIVIDEYGYNYLNFSKLNKSAMTTNEIEEIESEFLETTFQLLTQLESGVFANKPFNLNECSECDWRKMCRATHLA
jgi:ATP-dependent helicase/nuclease subunit B